MLIKQRFKRERTVRLHGVDYTFKPDELGRFVAQVDNPAHAKQLLALSAYSELVDDTPVQASFTSEPQSTVTPDGENEAQDGEGEQDDDEQEQEEEALDRDALAEKFKEKFGRLPHGKWDAERIAKELKADA